MSRLTFSLLLITSVQILFAQPKPKDIVIGQSIIINSQYLHRSTPVYITLPSNDITSTYPLAILLAADENDFRASILKNQFITVGIPSQNLKTDFLKEVDRDSYYNFIIKELLPYIKNHYQISNVKLITGHSLAGAFVVESLIKHPDKFAFYLATSPTLQIINKTELKNLELDHFNALYFSIGRSENYPELTQENHAFNFMLDSLHIQSLYWKFDVLKDENHETNAFTGFCKGYTYYKTFSIIPDSILQSSIDSIQIHIDKVKDEIGISIPMNENILMSNILLNLANHSYNNAATTIKYIANNQPKLIKQEENTFLQVAKELRINGGREMAYNTYKCIFEITKSNIAQKNLEELKQGF
nr:alpha/beta hydrolase-fold protein [uncultured Carboxylicivirga sp.]